MMDTCPNPWIHLSKPIECRRLNPNVNYGLWMIRIGQCKFINCNKYTTVMVDVDRRGGYACVGAGCTWEVYVPSQFCCEPKIVLKIFF